MIPGNIWRYKKISVVFHTYFKALFQTFLTILSVIAQCRIKLLDIICTLQELHTK